MGEDGNSNPVLAAGLRRRQVRDETRVVPRDRTIARGEDQGDAWDQG